MLSLAAAALSLFYPKWRTPVVLAAAALFCATGPGVFASFLVWRFGITVDFFWEIVAPAFPCALAAFVMIRWLKTHVANERPEART